MAPIHPLKGWTVVIPIRDPRTGKSRLGAGTDVNAAIARDTLTAALDCRSVARVVLVTDRLPWAEDLQISESRMQIVLQRQTGLGPAVAEGIQCAGQGAVAVMLGDLPGLTPADLEAGLEAASHLSLGMVADHCGSGTTLITALQATDHRPCFGENSAALHRGIGYQEIELDAVSTLRWDVDTADDLREALRRGTGPATTLAAAQLGALVR